MMDSYECKKHIMIKNIILYLYKKYNDKLWINIKEINMGEKNCKNEFYKLITAICIYKLHCIEIRTIL